MKQLAIYTGKTLAARETALLEPGDEVTVESIDTGTWQAWIRTVSLPYVNAVVPLSMLSPR